MSLAAGSTPNLRRMNGRVASTARHAIKHDVPQNKAPICQLG